MAINTDMKVELNATKILVKLWPVMLFPLVLIVFIGIGGYMFSSRLSDEIHMIIVMYLWLGGSSLIYFASVVSFCMDVKKMAQESTPSYRAA